jgi:integration host factor subunit beta
LVVPYTSGLTPGAAPALPEDEPIRTRCCLGCGGRVKLPQQLQGAVMATITKKELIDRIAEETDSKRVLVKKIIQVFLDEIIKELGNGNRLEFRDFGVFEAKIRAARTAQNPKTLERVEVPSKRTVRFKVGRLMKQRLIEGNAHFDEATGLPIDPRITRRRSGS